MPRPAFIPLATHASRIADIKPENVLVAIDDVEAVIEAESAPPPESASSSSDTPRSKLVGVPPSKGRGGNQTPRVQSAYITGSQPLASPGSSSSLNSMWDPATIDKLGFGMTRISKEDEERVVKQRSDEMKDMMSSVSLNGDASTSRSEHAHAHPHSPTHAPGDATMGSPTPSATLAIPETITVKIADLGNGALTHAFSSSLTDGCCSDMGGPPLYGRHPNTPISLSGSDHRCKMGPKCRRLERSVLGRSPRSSRYCNAYARVDI